MITKIIISLVNHEEVLHTDKLNFFEHDILHLDEDNINICINGIEFVLVAFAALIFEENVFFTRIRIYSSKLNMYEFPTYLIREEGMQVFDTQGTMSIYSRTNDPKITSLSRYKTKIKYMQYHMNNYQDIEKRIIEEYVDLETKLLNSAIEIALDDLKKQNIEVDYSIIDLMKSNLVVNKE